MKEIMRVNKTENYVVMSTYHLKDTHLSIEAKGLLTLLLSMPEDWDFSIESLKPMMREEASCIEKIIAELTAAGYFKNIELRDEKGAIIKREYSVYEKST